MHKLDGLLLPFCVFSGDVDLAVGGLGLGLLHALLDILAEVMQAVHKECRRHFQLQVDRARLWESRVLHGCLVAQHLLPQVLSKVGGNRCDQQSLHLNKAVEQVLVHLLVDIMARATGDSIAVLVTCVLQAKPAALDGLTEEHACVMLIRCCHDLVHLVFKDLIKEIVFTSAEGVLLDQTHGLLHPLNLLRELQDGGVRDRAHKICIIKAVPSIGQSQACGVTGELIHDVLQRKEVAPRLGHLLAVNRDVAVAVDALGPKFLGEHGCMVVEAHCQVVLDEVLARHTHVHRVPEQELIPHLLQSVLGDGGLQCVQGRASKEDIVPDSVGQLLGLDACCAQLLPIHVQVRAISLWPLASKPCPLVQNVANGIVSHVDGGVRERVNEVVKWTREGHLGAQPKGTRACMLVQPPDHFLKASPGPPGVGLQRVIDVIFHLSGPFLLAITQVPLVHQCDDAHVPGPADNLVLGLGVL
mmetsp:Transcript_103546/g.178432  ORF Transcript_103546/g.178432 Transcript_103546/m.178432 type:complete len:471 (+) Transcript_103546:891-2303(+)